MPPRRSQLNTHERARLRRAPGQVALVGAGPGDPDLLTLRALRAIQRADVVVYDNLVSDGVRALIPSDADVIFAGKRARCHALTQEEINKLLVALARQGKQVVRLKGGDPFVFGRGGEEAEFLALHGVPCEVVPGVTSASAAACCAGIPLTHRDLAQAVVFVTGHRKSGGCELDWPMLARPKQTLVIYMGLATVGVIARQLIAHGLAPQTPAAVVERATTTAQRVLVTTIETLPEQTARHAMKPPSLIIIGEVVALQHRLANAQTAAEAVAPHAGLAFV